MRSSKRQAVRNAFYRLGLHTPPKSIVDALRQKGILVDEELVRQVRIELVRGTTRGRITSVPRQVPSPAVRRRPQGFPKL